MPTDRADARLSRVNTLLVQYTRGDFVESTHPISASVFKQGAPTLTLGPPDAAALMRSSSKPVQALAALLTGAADRFAMTDAEIALACGSHSGEPHHVATASGLLARIGLGPDALLCGAHRPIYQPASDALVQAGEAEAALHNNCSGKHSGMLAACVAAGWETDGYLDPAHPLQRVILANTALLGGVCEGDIGIATDGCSVPTFHLPVAAAARTYALVATPTSAASIPAETASACERIMAAIAARPEMIGGTGRVDTDLPRATGGRLISKVGAEGLWCIGVRGAGVGIALKNATGIGGATYHAGLHLLRSLGHLSTDEWETLAPHHDPVRRNHRKLDVGRVRVSGLPA